MGECSTCPRSAAARWPAPGSSRSSRPASAPSARPSSSSPTAATRASPAGWATSPGSRDEAADPVRIPDTLMPRTLFDDIDPARVRAHLDEVTDAAAGRAEVLVACKYVPLE